MATANLGVHSNVTETGGTTTATATSTGPDKTFYKTFGIGR